MAALSAVVFTLSGWLGLYLLARDPRKPVLALAAIGLCGFALVVALDAVRTAGVAHAGCSAELEIYLVAVPSVAWFAVLVELSRPCDHWRARTREVLLVGGVGALTLFGAMMAGSVDGPLRPGHVLMFAAISISTLGAMVAALSAARSAGAGRRRGCGGDAVLCAGQRHPDHPAGPGAQLAGLGVHGFDVLLLGVAVAVWDAFDEGQALRADMLRSFAGSMAVAVLFGGQALIGLAVTRHEPTAQTVLSVLLFTSLAIAITVQVLADPLAGVLDRLAFSKSPTLRADRAALRHTGAALPLRSVDPLLDVDDETFARLTRRALGHYGDLTKLVASPLTALPVIDERLAARGAPDHPLERANELKAVLADAIGRLKPRDAGDFGTTEQWRHYNSLYFPYVVGVRAYAQNATASGLDPTARQAWQWFVTEVPQRSLHNWQNAAARLIAADLRGRVPVPSD